MYLFKSNPNKYIILLSFKALLQYLQTKKSVTSNLWCMTNLWRYIYYRSFDSLPFQDPKLANNKPFLQGKYSISSMSSHLSCRRTFLQIYAEFATHFTFHYRFAVYSSYFSCPRSPMFIYDVCYRHWWPYKYMYPSCLFSSKSSLSILVRLKIASPQHENKYFVCNKDPIIQYNVSYMQCQIDFFTGC